MSPACSTCPTPNRPCPRSCPLPTGRACGFVLNGEPLLLSDGEMHRRHAQPRSASRHAALGTDLSHDIRHHDSGSELRLVSLADRAVGLQLLRFSLDRDGIDVRLEASFGMSGLGMEPPRLEP